MFHFIYKTTNIITGKFYIGMHSTEDLSDGYQGSGKILLRSIKKHGKENHHTEILEHYSSREELANRECELVNKDLLSNPLCLNLKLGGEGGSGLSKHTEETKHKMSLAKKGKLSEETRKKMSESAKKRIREKRPQASDETKRKVSESIKELLAQKVYVFSMVERRSMLVEKDELDSWLAKGWYEGKRVNFDKPTPKYPFI